MGSMVRSRSPKGSVNFSASLISVSLLLHAHRPEAEAEDTGGHATHHRYAGQQAQPARWRERPVRTEHVRQYPALDLGLNRLDEAGRQLAPPLHRRQVLGVQIF